MVITDTISAGFANLVDRAVPLSRGCLECVSWSMLRLPVKLAWIFEGDLSYHISIAWINIKINYFLRHTSVTGLQSLITMYIFPFRHFKFQSLTHLFTYLFIHKFIQPGLLYYVRLAFVCCHVIVFCTVLGELGKMSIFRSYGTGF